MRARRWQSESLRKLRRQLRVLRGPHSAPDCEPAIERGSFVIARILGNDLFPRHRSGTMLKNLRFVLENETKPRGVRRLFILNRLVDKEQERRAAELIEAAGDEVLRIPFESDRFAELSWDFESVGGPGFFKSQEFLSLEAQRQDIARILVAGPKVAYAMNINGARNAALSAGRQMAEWTVPLDGSCIFTNASLDAFTRTCVSRLFAPCVVLPMERIDDYGRYGTYEPRTDTEEEPQLAFHCSSKINFDERFPYGVRDKTVILKSLGVPGPWNYWGKLAWLPDDDLRLEERFFFKHSNGAVFRLPSIPDGRESDGAQKVRHRLRNLSIASAIRKMCTEYGTQQPQHLATVFGKQDELDVWGSA